MMAQPTRGAGQQAACVLWCTADYTALIFPAWRLLHDLWEESVDDVHLLHLHFLDWKKMDEFVVRVAGGFMILSVL